MGFWSTVSRIGAGMMTGGLSEVARIPAISDNMGTIAPIAGGLAGIPGGAAGIAAGASIGNMVGSAYTANKAAQLAQQGAIAQNVASAAAADKQMAFQERMSSTAHTREVQDLRNAGLNPILSATGGSGSSSPSGAMAPVVDTVAPKVSAALKLADFSTNLVDILSRTLLNYSHRDAVAEDVKTKQFFNLGVDDFLTPEARNYRGFTGLNVSTTSSAFNKSKADAYLDTLASLETSLKKAQINLTATNDRYHSSLNRLTNLSYEQQRTLLPGMINRGEVEKSSATQYLAYIDRYLDTAKKAKDLIPPVFILP